MSDTQLFWLLVGIGSVFYVGMVALGNSLMAELYRKIDRAITDEFQELQDDK